MRTPPVSGQKRRPPHWVQLRSAFQGLRQLKDRLKPTDVPVVLFHDHGSRYTAKVYNDDWMREQGG